MGATVDEARRAAIIEAALTCFIRDGYARTRVEDIARAAGLSRPLLYRHFKSKEAVFVALAEQLFETALQRAKTALAGSDDVVERIHAALLAWTEDHFRLIGSPHGNELLEAETDSVRPLWVEAKATMERMMATTLEAATNAGELDLDARGLTPAGIAGTLNAAHYGLKSETTSRETYEARLQTLMTLLRHSTQP